ncbi:hypothetical protein [Gloeobacter violaceus]|uniref:Gll3357 protein n=1 Tax=Gloeobacter violaceus (strain ATCC 29082 / PCC 7421) TaxID=251221 RepID=Q7NG17_GLOVI|nr:hypothetical protein [Gloeobacter violaceus]BAC91298.1 gll3357 [Gloeobacter violaceus PCC 7421]
MARLPEESEIFDLLQRLIAIVDSAKALEFNLLQRYGEIPELILSLEQLDNITQRAADPYRRLTNLLLRIAESQPLPATATLELLQSTMEMRFGLAALERSVEEIRLTWRLDE